MKTFSQLKKNLKSDFSAFKKIKISVLGDTSTQLLVQALRGMGYEYGFDLQLWEADFNQIERQVFYSNSELYAFNPEIVIVFQSSHKLLSKYNKLHSEQRTNFSVSELELISNITTTINSKLNTKIIFYNYSEIDDSVFGNYANKVESSFLFQLRKLNYELMTFAVTNSNFYICDISSIQNQIGKSNVFDTSVYINTEMILSIDVLPHVATKTLDVIGTLHGKLKKC